MEEKWTVYNKTAAFEALAEEFQIDPMIARLLVNRDVRTSEEIRRFLYPSITDLHSGALIPDAQLFCAHMEQVLKRGQRVRIFGDYDVDGVCGTFLYHTGLSYLGYHVDYVIPHRRTDGYGISDAMMQQAIDDGVEVMLTVDTGISCVRQVEMAKAAGMLVLITDHHEPPERLPKADCLCDPKRKDSEYPEEICGAVVAAKLLDLLYERLKMGSFLEKHLDICALATICDVMKLVGENRTMVKLGLEALRTGGNRGLHCLMAASEILPEQLSGYHCGFVLGPCINASGRLEHAKAGVALLQSGPVEGAQLAKELVAINQLRKDKTNLSVQDALLQLKELEPLPYAPVVLYLPDCDESLAGIVAGRIREACYRPAIVLTDSEEAGMLKGSARSIEQFSIFGLLQQCDDLLVKYGGHEQAAGLSLRREDLEAFRKRVADCGVIAEDARARKRRIDIIMPFSYVTVEMVRQISLLEPFGTGMEAPLFAARAAVLAGISYVGKQSQYLKLTFSSGERYSQVMYFGEAEGFLEALAARFGASVVDGLFRQSASVSIHVLYTAKLHVYRGMESVSFEMKGWLLP